VLFLALSGMRRSLARRVHREAPRRDIESLASMV
jgi:hypothetical protein